MKIKRITSLMLLTALAWLVPKTATAAEYTFSAPTKKWGVSFSLPGTDGRQPSIAPDGKMFVLTNSAKYLSSYVGTYRITSAGVALVNTGLTSGGWANDFDDSGNYIIHAAGSEGPTQAGGSVGKCFIVRTYDSSQTGTNGVFPAHKKLDMSTYNTNDLTRYVDATGNVYSGTGYLWFAPTGTGTTITAITVSNGAVTGKKTFDTGKASGGGSDNYVQFYETSDPTAMKCLMQLRGMGLYDVTLNVNAGTVTSCVQIPDQSGRINSASLGAHIFTLCGHKFLVRNTRSNGTNTYTEFEILDITDSYTSPTVVATVNPLNGGSSAGISTGSYVQTRKVSDTQVELYTYTPGLGATCYTFTATEIQKAGAKVTNLKCAQTYDVASGTLTNTLTWTAPTGMVNTTLTGYKIYEGSTLLASPAASATSWVDSRQSTAAVTYKIVPVFTEIGEDNTYATSITAPAISITGAAVTNLGYNRQMNLVGGYQTNTLTWTAPTGYSNTNLTGYKIYEGATELGTADASATSWVDSRQVTSAVTYTVVPQYVGIADCSPYGASIAVPVVDRQGAPLTNLKGAIAWDAETSTQTNILTWTAPDTTKFYRTTLTGYKVLVGDVEYATLAATDTTFTETVTAKKTYTVYPIFSDLDEKPALGASVTIAKVSPVIPVINHVATFEGYNNVQVYWTPPANANTPNYYEVWRDGIKVSERKIVAYCNIETEVVEGDHYYEIKGVYTVDGKIESEPALVMTSAPYNFSVTARNMTYTNYALEEIYNYDIPQEGVTATADMINNTLCPKFYDYNAYRQGAYYNGYWYIMERASNGVYNSSDYPVYATEKTNGSVSRVLKVSAEDPRNNWSAAIEGIELSSSIGIAIDDAGNLFIRKNSREGIDATRPSELPDSAEAMASWMDEMFERRFTTGLIYLPKSDGTYDAANPVTIDLTKIYDNGFIYQLPDNTDTDERFESTRGRVDYYRLSGNIMSAEGGYLYLSYFESTYATRVKIANGAYVSHEHYNTAQYTDWSDNTVTLNPLGSVENYVFPIDGRDDVIAQLRSQVIVQLLDEHFKGTATETPLAVQRMTSRVNTAGGTTIAFNGDLFMISPQARYSRNLGDFIVMRANKTNVTDINTADLHWTIPVWQVEQDEISSAQKTNANGNWYFAEEGTWMIDGQEAPCVYIYQYVPGIRIAKYRLYPLTQFPHPEAQLDIVTGYQCDDNGNPIDIICFDGHVTWQKPVEYNYVEGQSTYRLDSYHLDILDAAGTVIDHAIVAHNDNQLVFAYDYAGTELLDDKTNYTARIYATYTDINGKEFISDKYNSLDVHEYVPAPPVIENVNAYIHSGLWDKDVYRVELNFAKPTETIEPVSYYSVYAKMPTGETVQITDFNLMVDGVENENIVDGVALLWDSIPGTYDFDANEAAWHAGLPEASPNKSTLVWYHTVEMGHYTHSSSMARATANDPSTWTYYVVANYASSNAKLATAEEASKTTDSDLIITGVEAVSAEVTGMLKVFPNPAHSVVNIQSVVAIETVALYNEAGAEVLNAAGNGENAMQLDVESLADGVYFLRVNNLPPVKIVKN